VSEATAVAGSTTKPEIWAWRGHRICWIRQSPSCQTTTPLPSPVLPAAVLIHGFGASIGHWRHNIPVLAEHVDVFALDLLGFGASDKPRSRLFDESEAAGAELYCFDLWASQVADFVAQHVQPRPVHLIGNSIGGVVALAAARLLVERGLPPCQVVLIDCAQRTLDEKRLGELPAWERAGRPLLKLFVRQRRLIAPLFRFLARPESIRRVLAIAYPSGRNVDDELVELLYRPATDPGAVESFRGFVNIFADLLAPDLLAEMELPVRMLWGEKDPWENPEEARQWAERFACIRELRILEGLGHCPHDEDPDQVNAVLTEWITRTA